MNVTLDSEQLEPLAAETVVYALDTSALDLVEQKADISAEQRMDYPKSLAWELEFGVS